jgi:hypothetical protein
MNCIRKVLFFFPENRGVGRFCRRMTCCLAMLFCMVQGAFLFWKLFDFLVRYRPLLRFIRKFVRRYIRIYILAGTGIAVLIETLLLCCLLYYLFTFLRKFAVRKNC